jgi:hypothetical protein
MGVAPVRLTIRSYGVGFGDCFLLSFHYDGARGDRHMLIDCGTTHTPPNARGNLLDAIVKDIATVVGGKLHVLVATHRHADHINGFATRADGKGPGDRIAALEPSLVIQPWTEKPSAPIDWKGPTGGAPRDGILTVALESMRQVVACSLAEAGALPRALRDEVEFVGDDALSNRSAVENLARMGKRGKASYVRYGSRVLTATLLPGVGIRILGPPTLRQKADLAQQKPTNRDEYWHFHSFWQLRSSTARMAVQGTSLFPGAATLRPQDYPPESRWFIDRVRGVRGEQLLRLVRAMDAALNNTSVILLIQAGRKRLLFSGDAQWENWEYALGKARAALKKVDVYKVGHHGSLNATPKSLWKLFERRSDSPEDPRRLVSLLSTRSDSKHGHRDRNTEVPRDTLLEALRSFTNLRSTQELEPSGDLVLKLELDLRH